ncbi:MAG: sigma-70 family RNA polymerase sigma factor [Ruminococcaceae bacterium]|nr:sigma-70 family RNA polymerase sigma factor [Oscillospiraceae bacterium]
MLVYLQMIETAEEQTKFERIYMQYRDIMYGTAYKILQDAQDAEDAVQQAFVKLAENIYKIEEPICPKTKGYIVTIVENKAIDMYRRRHAHPQVEYLDEIVGIQVEYNGSNTLAECILKLPARQRSVIILKYSHGYENKEIARILGISLSNAQKLDQRAKAKLRLLCEEAGIEW